jgi:CubicO group peptidase (beta-lactamase class C family)
MKKIILQFSILILLLAISVNSSTAIDKEPAYWPTNGWRTATPESQGMDSYLLIEMLDKILKTSLRVESALIIRNGYMVLDAYSYPYDSKIPHHIDACTQSVTSALVGIAIDKGYIGDVNQLVLDFFPKRVVKNIDTNKKTLELEHLLTMTSGFECSDPFLYLQSGMMNMILDANLRMRADWTQYIVDLPMAEAPGTRYRYCNFDPFLLSVIIQDKTGMDALAFAKKHLFDPLGISDIGWGSNPQGITLGYGELFMRPQDMAKIGFLYLNRGLWDGKRIISSRWINVSTKKHIDTILLPGYGYHWWIASPGIYTSAGNKGQFIMVAPEKNLVAVFTGRLSPSEFLIPLDFMKSYIITAIKAEAPLPSNKEGEKLLHTKSKEWQNIDPSK